MPNASELARLDREYVEAAVARVNNLKLGKAEREEALRIVRNYEDAHGVELLGNYNQSAQQQQDSVLRGAVVTLQDLKDARRRIETLTPGEIGTIIIALGEAPGPQAKALIAKILGR